MGDHFFGGIKNWGEPAGFDILVCLGQASVDNFALGRRVFVISGGKFGAVDDQLGCDDDLAALRQN